MAIFEGAGLDWFLPWNTCLDPCVPGDPAPSRRSSSWVPLVLTGIAVGFAFRCGLFNIGGQGQYLAGAMASVIIAPSCRCTSILAGAAHPADCSRAMAPVLCSRRSPGS